MQKSIIFTLVSSALVTFVLFSFYVMPMERQKEIFGTLINLPNYFFLIVGIAVAVTSLFGFIVGSMCEEAIISNIPEKVQTGLVFFIISTFIAYVYSYLIYKEDTLTYMVKLDYFLLMSIVLTFGYILGMIIHWASTYTFNRLGYYSS